MAVVSAISRNIRRWTKIILLLIGVLVVLCLMLVAVVLLTFDNDDYRQLLTRSVKYFTGYTMTIEGPFVLRLSARPSLAAEAIQFVSDADAPPPPITAIGKLRVQIALSSLLSGTLLVQELVAEDVVMAVTMGQESERGPPDGLAVGMPVFMNIPVLESVRLRRIHLDVIDKTTDRKVEIRLRQFSIDDLEDTGPLFVTGDGAVNEKDFQIQGRLGALADIFNEGQPYPVEIELKIVDFRMTVAGTIDRPLEGEGLDLQLGAAEQELAKLLDVFLLDVPAVGRLKFAGTLSGDLQAPGIVGLKLDIADGASVKLSARGSISNLRNGAGTYVGITAECTNQGLLELMFPDNWKVVKDFRLTGIVGNIEGDYTLEDIDAVVVNDRGITLKAAGWLRFGDFIGGNILKIVNLNLNLSSPHTDAIRPLLTDAIPEVGSITAEGRLTGPVERLALEDLVVRRGDAGPLQMISKGRIGWIPLADDQPIAGIDLNVSIQAERSEILSSFYGVPIGDLGSLSLTGRVTGATDRFQLGDLQMRTADTHGLQTALAGGIDFAEQETGKLLGNVNCKLRIEAPSMKAVEPLTGATLFAGLGPVSAEAAVTGTTDVLVIDDIAVTAGRPQRVQIKWNGRIGRFPLAEDEPFSGVNTVAALQAADASALAELFDISLPDIGPLQGGWRATGRNGTVGFEDLKLVVGDGKKFSLDAAGAVDSVFRQGELSLEGIDLQIHVHADDTHLVSKLFGRQIPDLGSVDGRLSVSGGRKKIAVSGIDLTTLSPKGLQIKTTGAVDQIGLEKETAIGDVDLRLTASAPDTAAVPLFTDLDLPALGAFHLEAQLNDREGGLDLESFEVRTVAGEETTLHINGRIDHIYGRKQKAMNLQADFEILSQPWLEAYLKRSMGESPRFSGSVQLSRSADRARIDGFEIATEAFGGLSVQASGTLKTLVEKPQIDVHIISAAGNPSAWGAVLGVSLPRAGPLSLNGRYTRQADTHVYEGQTRFGNTQFETIFRGAFDRRRPAVDLVLSAASVNLEDLGFYPEAQTATPVALPAPQKEKDVSVFDETPLPLDGLRALDFSLRLDADTVLGKNVAIEKVGLDVILEAGRLIVGPATLNYSQGSMSYEASLDVADAKPTIAMKIDAEDIDIDDVLSYLHEPLIIEGQLNLVVDLRSSGRSIKQIASGLAGEFSFAIENGRIQRAINLLAADALDFLFSAAAKNTYTDLNCMAARLMFEDGTGAIEVLYLDTPAVRARGAGSVNLADETLEVVVKPEAKRRLLKRSSPVRIRGPLGNPTVKKIPASEAATLAGQILAPYVALPARALGYLWSLMRDDKDEKSPCVLQTRSTDSR